MPTRTSKTDPLQIDFVQVPHATGEIGMTLCPGKQQKHAQTGSWERDLIEEIDAIVRWDASAVVSLIDWIQDVRELHRDAANANAMFQVASQFNFLEMTGSDVSPEDGVTRYQSDRTQGPACAIAAGAATLYRNYFAVVDGAVGQTRHRQIDCLRGYQ